MTAEHEQMRGIVAQLCQSPDPVTFYDAMTVVRHARRLGDLSDNIVHSLIALHDAEHATDGAKDILAEFLGGYGQRQAAERDLAGRPITIKDSGKRARAYAGDTLLVSLDENRSSGFRWEVVRQQGPIQCRRRVDRAAAATRAEFDVRLVNRGRAILSLQETPPPTPRPPKGHKAGRRNRCFELEVLVDPR